MIITVPLHGVFTTQAYFIIDEETQQGILIDPGAQADVIMEMIEQHHWQITKIVLTHGHFDHIGAVKKLQDKLQISVYAFEKSGRYLLNPELNLSARFDSDMIIEQFETFHDREVLPLFDGASDGLTVLHTPGHTQDSCSFYYQALGVMFVGDLIYEGGLGLTIFPDGDEVLIKQSVGTTLFTLPDETMLLSGHSKPISIAALKENLGIKKL